MNLISNFTRIKMKKYIFCLLALVAATTLSAQTLSQAKKLFDNGDYETARTAFEKLIKRSPASAEVNYYYGASLYETGEVNRSLPYLEKSAKRNYIGAFRYLGKAYAQLYRYDEAVENYETHIDWLNEKNRDTEEAEAELSDVRQKARMYKSVEKVAVIDSFTVNKQDFLKAYKMGKESGHIGMNKAGNGTVYENEIGSYRIVSEQEDSLIRLYAQSRLLDGWSEKEAIESLNGDYNVNYPFLLGDGVTLYYAHDGEGSLGGYDIFVTRYDSEDNTYLKPGNVGMPFNSTANDYLYAIDALNNLGWFVSDRNQPADTVCVYVFIPNDTREMYNYESTDPEVIKNAATLQNIRATWTDEDKVRSGRQRLSALIYGKKEQEQKADFRFIINDSATYTTLADFQSKEAQNAYRQLMQKEKDLSQLKRTLELKRNEYSNENGLGKKKLEPSILDLEKRIPQLTKEIEKFRLEVRKLEIQKLTK